MVITYVVLRRKKKIRGSGRTINYAQIDNRSGQIVRTSPGPWDKHRTHQEGGRESHANQWSPDSKFCRASDLYRTRMKLLGNMGTVRCTGPSDVVFVTRAAIYWIEEKGMFVWSIEPPSDMDFERESWKQLHCNGLSKGVIDLINAHMSVIRDASNLRHRPKDEGEQERLWLAVRDGEDPHHRSDVDQRNIDGHRPIDWLVLPVVHDSLHRVFGKRDWVERQLTAMQNGVSRIRCHGDDCPMFRDIRTLLYESLEGQARVHELWEQLLRSTSHQGLSLVTTSVRVWYTQ